MNTPLPGSPERSPTDGPRPGGSETQIVTRQRLDFALQLARAVALDFNNALTGVLGHVSLVLSKMEPDHPWRNYLIQAEKSTFRAARIAEDLGTFSRQEKQGGTEAASLTLLLQRVVAACQHSELGAHVKWDLQWEPSLFAVKFDEAKLQQAIMKLLENAVEATPAGGRIRVQTRNLELSEPTQDRNVPLPPGTYVCTEIADTGSGIAPEILPRIFEPFFTTKGGRHRGLGLAWVYGVITNHGGGVAVSSQPGRGTSVRVYLPAEKLTLADRHLVLEELRGSETVLVVDDEEVLLTLCETILLEYGYRVLTANSGEKALEMLRASTSIVDLLLTDLFMPTMGGAELADHVRKLSPATRILFSSGYVRQPGQPHRENWLQKPYTARDLLLKVRQCLTEAPPPADQAPGP